MTYNNIKTNLMYTFTPQHWKEIEKREKTREKNLHDCVDEDMKNP